MITALVPIKQESERLKNKNFLDFCGQPLYQIVLDTLQGMDEITQIIIDTDSKIIKEDCSPRYSKAIIIDRPPHLIGNEITMNSIIEYDLSQVQGEYFLQTHVTNPLLTVKTIRASIKNYFDMLSTYDCLLSVQQIKKRAYDNYGNPMNHSNDKLEQTQVLPPINIENSNIFLFSRTSFFTSNKSRVGKRPQLFPMSSVESIDIDYEEDFLLAKLIQTNKGQFKF